MVVFFVSNGYIKQSSKRFMGLLLFNAIKGVKLKDYK